MLDNYTPTVKFDIRKELATKALARLMLVTEEINQALGMGYSLGEVIES
jgi:hypothetical protein